VSREKELQIKVNPWYVAGILILLGIGMFLWATRPLWHGLFFFLYINPMPWGILAVAVAITVWLVIALERWDYGYRGERFPWISLVVAIVAWLAFFSSFYVADAITHAYMAEEMKPEITTELPETERVRFVPLEVAETLARNKQEDSRLQVGDMDPIDFNENFLWVAPRVPNGFVNSFVYQMDGFMVIDNDTNLTVIHQPFKYGEEMFLHHNILWQFMVRGYWAKYPEIFYLPVEPDGGWLGVAPYIKYHFRFPVQVPYWAGAMVFHANGTIEDLTVEEGRGDPRFAGQRLFPEELTDYQAASWAYKEGIFNAWFFHRDQIEVPELAHSENQMPYLLPGNIWMVATEPVGPSQSVKKIFFFDAHDGTIQLFEFDPEHAKIGPNVGWGYAKAGTQAGYIWAEEGEEGGTGTYLVIEPRPLINDGVLFWMYTVTVQQKTGIALTILVENEDNVLHFCSKASLDRWMAGVGGSDPIPCGATVSCPQLKDLSEMSEDELLGLMRQIVEELSRR